MLVKQSLILAVNSDETLKVKGSAPTAHQPHCISHDINIYPAGMDIEILAHRS
jgi:hypothetical protein